MASVTDVEQLRQKLRIGGGTLVDQWLSTTVDYFRDELHLDPFDRVHGDYLRGIDFHRPVKLEPLLPGQLLVRFPEIAEGSIKPERKKPYRFFALPGSTALHLGWNMDEVGYQLYQLRQPVRALMSVANAVRFHDSRSRLGGNAQIIVPWATNVALLRQRDFDREKLATMWRAGYRPLGLP